MGVTFTPLTTTSIEEMCRLLLCRAMSDGLIGRGSHSQVQHDIMNLSCGDLVGVANMLHEYIRLLIAGASDETKQKCVERPPLVPGGWVGHSAALAQHAKQCDDCTFARAVGDIAHLLMFSQMKVTVACKKCGRTAMVSWEDVKPIDPEETKLSPPRDMKPGGE